MKLNAETVSTPNLVEIRGHFFNLQMGLISYVRLLREFGTGISGIVERMSEYRDFLTVVRILVQEAAEIEAEHGGELRDVTVEEIGKEIAGNPRIAVVLQNAVINAFRYSLGERDEAEAEGEREILAELEGEDFEEEQPETEESFDFDNLYFALKMRLNMSDSEIYHMTVKKAAWLIEKINKGSDRNGRNE